MKIIEQLDLKLNEKGITAYKIEKDLGIKQSTITSWRKGSEPSAEKILKIIQYLGVSPNEFFGYNEIDLPDQDPDPEDLTDNEQEMLKLFKQLPEREQIKMIGRIEDKIKALKE